MQAAKVIKITNSLSVFLSVSAVSVSAVCVIATFSGIRKEKPGSPNTCYHAQIIEGAKCPEEYTIFMLLTKYDIYGYTVQET